MSLPKKSILSDGIRALKEALKLSSFFNYSDTEVPSAQSFRFVDFKNLFNVLNKMYIILFNSMNKIFTFLFIELNNVR